MRRRSRRSADDRAAGAPLTGDADPPKSVGIRDPRDTDRLTWLLVPGLLALGAGVRALRFEAPFFWPFLWDESIPAVPALQVLRGSLPVTAGPEYFGAGPSYLLAAWFAAAGSSPLALDIFAYAIGLLIFWTGWLLLRRFLDRPAALFGLAFLAVPPLFLARWSLMTANHVPNVLVGNLCLLATHTIFRAAPGRPRAILVLGLVAGLGWWTSPLIVVYLVPFAVLALRTGLVWRPRIGLFPVGFLLGGLPAWLYELRNFPSARFALHAAGGVPVALFHDRVTAVAGTFLPTLLGLHLESGRPWLMIFLLVAVPLWAAALIGAAIRGRAELAWLLGRGGQLGRGHDHPLDRRRRKSGAGARHEARDRRTTTSCPSTRSSPAGWATCWTGCAGAAAGSRARRSSASWRSTGGPTGTTASGASARLAGRPWSGASGRRFAGWRTAGSIART